MTQDHTQVVRAGAGTQAGELGMWHCLNLASEGGIGRKDDRGWGWGEGGGGIRRVGLRGKLAQDRQERNKELESDR